MWKYDSKDNTHTHKQTNKRVGYSTRIITNAFYSVYIARSDYIDENNDYF